jgi:hypothetical protein
MRPRASRSSAQILEAIALRSRSRRKADARRERAERKQRDEEKKGQSEAKAARRRIANSSSAWIRSPRSLRPHLSRRARPGIRSSRRSSSSSMSARCTAARTSRRSRRRRASASSMGENVVFDPRGEVDQLEDDRINLFRGLEIKPDPECGCELLGCSFYLCGEDQAVYRMGHALARAAAAALGSKCRRRSSCTARRRERGKTCSSPRSPRSTASTAALSRSASSRAISIPGSRKAVHGRERGRHARRDAPSGRLRSAFDYRAENLDQSEKNAERAREEANHMNLVFSRTRIRRSSSRGRIGALSSSARRGRCRKSAIPRGRRRARAGGAAALYCLLLERSSSATSIRIRSRSETQAKEDMIELGLASPQLFWQDFYEGEFPLPYQPCLREDLYRAYLAWCARYGEKMPKRINQFIPEFKHERRQLRSPARQVDGKRSASGASRSCSTTRRTDNPDNPEKIEQRECIAQIRAAIRAFRSKRFVRPCLAGSPLPAGSQAALSPGERGWCDEHRPQRHKSYNERRRQIPSRFVAFYGSREWRELAEQYRARHPFCQCGQHGEREVLGDMVDHRIELEDGGASLDPRTCRR